MFLETQSLDVSFRVKHSDGFYMVYASAGLMKCFECGDVGHKQVLCPHRQIGAGAAAATPSTGSAGTGSTDAPSAVGGFVAAVAAPVSDHRASDKTPVVSSDTDRALGSQLPIVGDWEGAVAAEGEVMEAEPSPSGQNSKGLSNSQVLSEDEEDKEEEESDTEKLTGAEKG